MGMSHDTNEAMVDVLAAELSSANGAVCLNLTLKVVTDQQRTCELSSDATDGVSEVVSSADDVTRDLVGCATDGWCA